MISLIFRRPFGQHLLVFLPTLTSCMILMSRLVIPDFLFAAPLQTLLTLGPNEERMVGSSPTLQIIVKLGFTTLVPGPKYTRPEVWPEHYVVVPHAYISALLKDNRAYTWAPGMCNGAFDHVFDHLSSSNVSVYDIRSAPDTYGFTPELVGEGKPYVFVLPRDDVLNLWMTHGQII
jgi:hypothetical protein